MQLKSFSTENRELGSASLEFITAGLLLLIPIIYLVLSVSVVQAATLATEGAARHAARVFIDAGDVNSANLRAQSAVTSTLEDYGIPISVSEVRIQCQNPAKCLQPGSAVHVSVQSAVTLPGIPAVLGLDQLTRVNLKSDSTMIVSRFHE